MFRGYIDLISHTELSIALPSPKRPGNITVNALPKSSPEKVEPVITLVNNSTVFLKNVLPLLGYEKSPTYLYVNSVSSKNIG
jgi:hypothetical protein